MCVTTEIGIDETVGTCDSSSNLMLTHQIHYIIEIYSYTVKSCNSDFIPPQTFFQVGYNSLKYNFQYLSTLGNSRGRNKVHWCILFTK